MLRDVPSSPIEMLKTMEKDSVRLGLYPNLDYKGLYNAIVQLTDVVPLIQYGLNGLFLLISVSSSLSKLWREKSIELSLFILLNLESF